MKVVDTIKSLQRFPQDAQVFFNGRDIVVCLYGYLVEHKYDNLQYIAAPSYCIYADDEELPWLSDPKWFEEHKDPN